MAVRAKNAEIRTITGNLSGNATSATTATNDTKGQAITSYIRALSISGRTIAYTKGDGTTGTLTTQDTNEDMKVFQTITTTTNYRPLIMGCSDSTDPSALEKSVTDLVYVNAKFYAQPSSGTIFATTFSGALSGNAATATKLETARTISLTGSVTGSGTFDGSGNLSIATTTNHSHSYLPLSGGTLSGDLNFSHTSGTKNGYISWNTGDIRQRIQITDDSVADTDVFTFQQSTDAGSTWTTLCSIKDNGRVVASMFNGRLVTGGQYVSNAAGRFNHSALEIRENDGVGNTQSDIGYAPTIGFHWKDRIAATFLFHTDGNFYLKKQDGVTRASLDANLIGNASTATALSGFNTASAFWGAANEIAKTGTVIKRMDTPNGGGSIVFSERGSQLDLTIDGYLFQDEGRYLVLDSNNYKTYCTPANIGALPSSGGTLTGALHLSYTTNSDMTHNSTNPQIVFSENGDQPVKIIYTDYDAYRSPAGLKVIGGTNATPAWFEVEGTVYAPTFKGVLDGNATTATTASIARMVYNENLTYGANGLQYFSIQTSTTSGKANAVPVANKWYHIIRMNHPNSAGYFCDIAFPLDNLNDPAFRVMMDGAETVPWRTFLTSNNYKSFCTPANIGAAASSHTHDYLPLAGGTMTGDISYRDTLGGTRKVIQFKTGGDVNGAGIVIGGGGTTIVGSGESAYRTSEQISNFSNENLYLTSDGDVYLLSNVDTGYSNGKVAAFTTAGVFMAPSFKVADKVALQYNSANECLDFVFS